MASDVARRFEVDHRRLIGRARRVDLAFACAGLLVMGIAMAMLLALIVDLLVGKLMRLPASPQEALKLLACLGPRMEVAILSMARGSSEQETLG